jgi:hypothetical protein
LLTPLPQWLAGFFTSFRQFFSSNEARIGGFAMDEEEGGL